MRRRIGIVVAIAVVVAGLACCPMGRRVTLRGEDGVIVYAARVPRDELVWILYTHSVNKGLVEDGYEPLDDKLHLRCTRVRQYGAGIPEPEPGQTFSVHDGYYQISGFTIVLDTQWTFVGRVADHRLRVGEAGEIVHYDQLAVPGKRLGLSTDFWSILKELQWRCRRA